MLGMFFRVYCLAQCEQKRGFAGSTKHTLDSKGQCYVMTVMTDISRVEDQADIYLALESHRQYIQCLTHLHSLMSYLPLHAKVPQLGMIHQISVPESNDSCLQVSDRRKIRNACKR